MIRHRAGVVVGVKDGQHAALAAAVRQARLRSLPLTVIHAYDVRLDAAALAEADDVLRVAHRRADDVVNAALRFARPIAAGVTISGESVRSDASDVLTRWSGLADLVVVGAEGHRFRDRLSEATVAREVVGRAQCPVLVVPEGLPSWREQGSVTVVVDDAQATEDLTHVALEEARRSGTQLVVVRIVDGAAAPVRHQDPTAWFSAFLGGGGAEYPDVVVRWAGDDENKDLCVKEATAAAVVVVGTPVGRSILHSTSGASSFVLTHAEGPVLVVPATDGEHP